MDTLILLAGGSGSRLGSTLNKVFEDLNGRPLIWYPLTAARGLSPAVEVVVVIRRQDRGRMEDSLVSVPGTTARVVIGGESRAESEAAGIEAARGATLIGIHDGARPFLTSDLWHRCRLRASDVGGAVPVVAGAPIYRVSTQGQIRVRALRAQTPQVFEASRLRVAYRRPNPRARDTAEAVMALEQGPIAAVEGDPRNLKVTYPIDLARARQLAGDWRQGAWLSPL